MKTSNNITKSKYIRFLICLTGYFVLICLISIFYGVLDDSLLISLGVILIFGVFTFLIPFCNYLIKIIKLDKQVASRDKRIGKIENWQRGFIRILGNVSLTVNGLEYFSDSVYTCNEARDYVGKSVSYCIINDRLVILDFDKTYENSL